jgi:Rps23 Pro-64 3,4-dihydroxylase Tpa1-like proline 4-hydroxylase
MDPVFRLDPRLDAAALAREYEQSGRVRIVGLLDGTAAVSLHDELRARVDWQQIVLTEQRVVELSRAMRHSMSDEGRSALDKAVYARARQGFQFRYEAIRVPDTAAERCASADPLARLAEWMSGTEVRDFLSAIIGASDITFADAQATAFSPGDFLTGHDDEVQGRQRRAAYVLGLTPVWRAEWGGLLLFHDEAGVKGVVPSFNTLDLFRVPQVHSVSEVTRAAAYRRYSVTGWLRADPAG